MNRYRFDIRGFFSHIPVILRKSKITTLLHILLRPLKYTHDGFMDLRNAMEKRWQYTGQVFGLQKTIREYCNDNDCRISDGEYLEEFFVPYDGNERLANYQVDAPYDDTVELQVNVLYAGFLQIEQSDFIVHLPVTLENAIDEAGLRALIDSYKIAGKFYKIVYE